MEETKEQPKQRKRLQSYGRTKLTEAEKPLVLKNNELRRKISEKLQGAYSDFEIKDVMNAIVHVIGDSLEEGRPVRIEHLFTLIPRKNEPRMFYSGIKKTQMLSYGSVSVKVALNAHLVGRANGTQYFDERNEPTFLEDDEDDD